MARTEVVLADRIQSAQLAIGRAAAESEHVPDFLSSAGGLAAEMVGAGGAGFWGLDPGGESVSLLSSHGRPPERAQSAVQSLLFGGRDGAPGGADDYIPAGDVLAAVWRAGDTLLGALCAYEPRSPGGFTDEDTLVLRTTAYSAGNVYERLKVLEQLRSAELRLARMLSISETLNSILDPDELVDTLVAQAMEMLNCSAGSAGLRRPEGMVCKTFFLQGQTIPFDYCWPPGHGTPGWCLVHKAPYLTNDAVHDAQFVPVLRDRLVIERVLCTPIVAADGEVLGFFVLYNKPDDFDEDDRELMSGLANHAAMALQNALAYRRLGELEQAKSDFLNLAAHELRGPVATARGHLEMLADTEAPWPPAQRELMLAVATSKLDHIRFLVDQMLTTARLDEQRLQLDLEELDLRQMIESALNDVAYAIKPGHHMIVEAGDDPIVVRADRSRIETALANLIENACKYSPEGGVVWIRCQATGTPAWAEVVIEDHGVGIAEEDLPKLFTRFGRIVTTENSHIPGTGLGLYLSRQLALMHGGDITVESVTGEGSRFSLRLPLVLPSGEDAQAQVFSRQVEELNRRLQVRGAAPPAMLPGENPSSPYPRDAQHWVMVYQELLKVKEDMLEQLSVRRRRTHAAQSQVDHEEQTLKLEVERLRTHLHYWEERAQRQE